MFDCDSHRVGGCLVDFAAKHLTVVEDVSSDDLHLTIRALLTQLSISKVLMSSRVDTAVWDLIQSQSATQNFTYEVIKAKSFARQSAIRAIDSVLDTTQSCSVYPLLTEMKFHKNMIMAV